LQQYSGNLNSKFFLKPNCLLVRPRNRATLLLLWGFYFMVLSFHSLLGFVILFTLLKLPVVGDETRKPDLATADQLYRSGRFAEAESTYKSILDRDSNLVPAQVGLVRAVLRQQKIDAALDVVNAALAVHPDAASLLAAKGDVEFRRGEMSDAEEAYLAAKRFDSKEARAYLGLAKLYRAYALFGKAYDQLQRAHEIAPEDVEVQGLWLRSLPRKERLAALQAYLHGPHPDDEAETKWMSEYLDFLEATADKPAHACKLTSKVEQTGTKLESMYSDSRRMRGIGLSVRLNDRNVRLLLDTGAGGIIVNHKIAEKAGLTRISAMHYGGLGDKGLQTGYTAVADHIRIGELEFQDCVVAVSDKGSIAEEDGLIGADVLSSYLIELDLPGMRLKLSPLPKRPEDAVAPKSLNSEGDEQATGEQPGGTSQQTSAEPKSSSADLKHPGVTPRDRYVAPEMANWTRVFRFGHNILVPTSVNDSKSLLFGLDTGAFANILSERAGRRIGKVSSEDRMRVRGLNGEVNKVYSSDKADLRFGHLRQSNLDMITLDLSQISRHTGTEISGFLGFSMLRMLDVKLDYRDGLVDFEYDPKRIPIPAR
jgi:tetratricopeptide (TPR) repeat protein